MLKIITSLYIVALIVLSLFPLLGMEAGGNSDKIAHFIAYTVLSVLFYFSSSNSKKRIYLLLFVIAIGVILEALQLLVPGRNFSYYDLLANIAGGFLGFGISWMLLQSTERPSYGGCGSPNTTVTVKQCEETEPR